MSEMNGYKRKMQVLDHDCDWNRRMTAGALLRMAQQIATEQCDSIGMDQAFYQRSHAVFLLARAALRFIRVPECGEILTLETMPELAHRATYKRGTRVLDEAGELVALVDSRWILVNTDTKRILRQPPGSFQSLPFAQKVPFELPQEIQTPEQTESCGTLFAAYSLCDENGHVNNTRYADAAADALPQECLKKQSVLEFAIRYHRELPAGERAELTRGKLSDGRWYVKGERDGKPCFESLLKLG